MVKLKQAILFICLFILFSPYLGEGAEEYIPVQAIEINGHRVIEEDTIRHQIKTRVGDIFKPFLIRQDIVSIYKIGYIEDIKVESEPFEGGIKLIYIIKERPSIRNIIFEGNKKIKMDTLKEKIDLKEKTFLDKGAINQNIGKLIQHYQSEGFYLVEIDYRLEDVDEGWVNVYIIIDEGKKVKIREIVFSGNEHFKDRVLQKEIGTKTYGLFSWLSRKGFLNKEVLDADRFRIQNYYLDRGFIHCQVFSPVAELDEKRERLTVMFTINEGDLYQIEDVSITGNFIYSIENLEEFIKVKSGDVYSRSAISKDTISITDAYGEKGYLTTEVYPSISEKPDKKAVSIIYRIKEGGPSYLRWINISGNNKTRDKVIRREMSVKEGDLLDTKRMRESYRRVRSLGFFEELDMQTVPTMLEDRFDLDLTVEERLTGQISLGAGYSSEDHLVGTFEIRQGNLFGRGQRLSAAAELGGERQTYSLSFTEPYFMDKSLTLGAGIYYEIKEYDNYTRSSRGGDLNFGFPLPMDFRFFTNYNYENVNITEVDPYILARDANNQELTFFEQSLIDAQGESDSSSLLFAISRDTRDDRFRPTSGSNNRLSFKYAGGILGGDNWFYSTSIDSGMYIPLPWWKFILALHGNLTYASGHGGKNLPVFERLYCGGTSTVRGYSQRGIGPKDIYDNPTGGNKRVVFNTEIHFPIYEAMNGLFFFDAGNVFDEQQYFFAESLRMSAGIGIRLYTPMGPMRLDWGYKLLRRVTESPSDWHFAIGTYF
ncbi:outer membrane protein assembly factor BamA [bacterium]|nr:outer membrane protein assembly factor BamA [bacterium]